MNGFLLFLAKSFLVVLIGMQSLLTFANESNKPVVLAVFAMTPYVDNTLQGGGLAVHIAKRAFEEAGRDVVFNYYPTARASLLAATGEVDGFLMATTNFQTDRFHYSEPFLSSEIVFYAKRGHALVYDNPGSLKDRPLATLVGWGVEASFPDHSWTRVDEAEQMLKMLQANRVDAILYESKAYRSVINRSSMFSLDDFVPLEPIITPVDYGIAVSKGSDDADALIERFNVGLRMLQSSGELERILADY